MRDYRENGAWPAGIGPKPDEPGCLAPPEILKKYGYTTKKGSGA